MAILADIVNYCNLGPTGFTGPTGPSAPTGCFLAVQTWKGPTAWSAGTIVRMATGPAVGSERCFISLTGGTGSTGTEPTWVITRGALTSEAAPSTMIWQECTGLAGLNGDLTNTATWAQLKAASTPTLGCLIQRNNGASLQICQTAGTLGAAEPSFSDTAGTRTAESGGTAIWISLGAPSNYKPWGAPHARLANACTTTWSPFGVTGGALSTIAGFGTIFVGDNHAEQATNGITITPILANGGVLKILCVDHTVANPGNANLKTTGVIWNTGAANVTLSAITGGIYIYGLTFMCGSAALVSTLVFTPSNANYFMDNCNFILNSTANGSSIIMDNGNAGNITIWNNCSMKFGAIGQFVDMGNIDWLWQNSVMLAPSSTSPTTLFGNSANGRLAIVLFEGLDMSSFTGQLNGTQNTFNMRNFTVKDCKLNTSMTLLNPVNTNEIYQFINCEVGATGTAFKSSRYNYEGTETTETTITRVGGAIDPMGNAQSRKIVTNGGIAVQLKPYRAEPMAVYNGRTGTVVNVSVYGTWTGPTGPSSDQIWLETEFLGTTGYPLGVIYNNTRPNPLGPTGPVWPTDGSTWNGGGSTSPFTPFVMTVGLTGATGITGVTGPQWGGLIHVRPRIAAPTSTTFYIDPKIVLS